MPEIFRNGPYRFFFFSNEGNEPIHIHVESGDNYCKFWITPVQLSSNQGFNSKELKDIHELILKNLVTIKECWNDYFK